MDASTLELRWHIRSGGGGRTERRYLDFVVDGRSLSDRFQTRDQVTLLGCWSPDIERQYIRELLLRSQVTLPSGRLPVYVCAECGDIGCGAVTAFVERTTDGFVWRNFAFENHDGHATEVDSYREIGPFVFNETDYWHVLSERVAALSAA